jgi:hypothetical protein
MTVTVYADSTKDLVTLLQHIQEKLQSGKVNAPAFYSNTLIGTAEFLLVEIPKQLYINFSEEVKE